MVDLDSLALFGFLGIIIVIIPRAHGCPPRIALPASQQRMGWTRSTAGAVSLDGHLGRSLIPRTDLSLHVRQGDGAFDGVFQLLTEDWAKIALLSEQWAWILEISGSLGHGHSVEKSETIHSTALPEL